MSHGPDRDGRAGRGHRASGYVAILRAWLRNNRDEIIRDSIVGLIVLFVVAVFVAVFHGIPRPWQTDASDLSPSLATPVGTLPEGMTREPAIGTRPINADSSAEFDHGNLVVSIGKVSHGAASDITIRVGQQHCNFEIQRPGAAMGAVASGRSYRVDLRGVSSRARFVAYYWSVNRLDPMAPIRCLSLFPKSFP